MTDKSSDAFRTISEVSAALDVPPHVLRFWETKFTSLRPLKRSAAVAAAITGLTMSLCLREFGTYYIKTALP